MRRELQWLARGHTIKIEKQHLNFSPVCKVILEEK
jgi:hypothetical protein